MAARPHDFTHQTPQAADKGVGCPRYSFLACASLWVWFLWQGGRVRMSAASHSQRRSPRQFVTSLCGAWGGCVCVAARPTHDFTQQPSQAAEKKRSRESRRMPRGISLAYGSLRIRCLRWGGGCVWHPHTPNEGLDVFVTSVCLWVCRCVCGRSIPTFQPAPTPGSRKRGRPRQLVLAHASLGGSCLRLGVCGRPTPPSKRSR